MLKQLFQLADVTVGEPGKPLVTVNGGFSGNLFDLFGIAANFLVFVTGAISVIMIIVGGLMFVLSQGDPGRTKTARETILYAVIGLVVSLAAFAIITFVKGALIK